MSNKITWKFVGLPSTFTTDSDKLEMTVNQLRKRNYLTYDHEIEILSNGNTPTSESVANDLPVSNIDHNPKKRRSVSKSAKDHESVEETPIVRQVPDILDDTNPESDLV